MKTEFVDRSGKPIYIGDIVQYRLTGGGTLVKVVQTKKGVKLVDLRYEEKHPNQAYKGSISMGKQYEKYVSIIDTTARAGMQAM